MAVKASFTADFASFSKAVQAADVQLKAFESDANKVQTSLNKMGDAFSGQKVIQQATLMAAAMEKAGGITKLTEAELRKLNDTTSEAALKMQKLGYEVPKSFNDIAQAVKELPQPTQSWSEKLTNVTTVIQGLLALQVVRWAQQGIASVINYTDKLSNLSQATGLTLDGLQSLEDIGVTSGVSVETLARSVELLQKNLDDPKAMAAIDGLSLNFDQIRSLAPDKQFFAIAQALAQIEDPVTKARLGTDLFGRSWFELAPAIHGDIEEIIKDIHHMSDEQIKTGDTLGDYWQTFWLNFNRYAGSALTETARLVKQFAEQAAPPEEVSTPFGLAGAGQFLPGGLPGLPGAPRQRIGGGANVGTSDSLLLQLGGRTLEMQQAAARAAEEAAKDWAKLDDATRGIISTSYLGGLALLKLGETTRLAGLDIRNLTDGMAKLAPTLALPQVQGLFGNGAAQGTATLNAGTEYQTSVLAGGPAKIVGQAPTIATSFATNLVGAIPSAIQAAIAGGGSKFEAAGSAFGLAIFGPNSAATKTITKGVESIFGKGGAIASIITGSIPIIGSLIGPLVGLFGKLFGPSEESQYVSPLRDEFFRLQGGLETLNPKIQELTGSLKLVQAVFDAKTVNQYNAAIKAVEDTLARIPQDVSTTVRVNFDVTDFQRAADQAAAGYNPDFSPAEGSMGGIVYAARGRIIPFTPRGSDTVAAMLTPGEMVLTPQQQRALLGSGGGSVMLDLRGSVVASDRALNDLVDKIERRMRDKSLAIRKGVA